MCQPFPQCPAGRGCPSPTGLDLLPGVGRGARGGGSLSYCFRCLANLSIDLSSAHILWVLSPVMQQSIKTSPVTEMGKTGVGGRG